MPRLKPFLVIAVVFAPVVTEVVVNRAAPEPRSANTARPAAADHAR